VPANEAELLDALTGELMQRVAAVVTGSQEVVQALQGRYGDGTNGSFQAVTGLATLAKIVTGDDSAADLAARMVDLYRTILGSC
jgi:hypothetical protein